MARRLKPCQSYNYKPSNMEHNDSSTDYTSFSESESFLTVHADDTNSKKDSTISSPTICSAKSVLCPSQYTNALCKEKKKNILYVDDLSLFSLKPPPATLQRRVIYEDAQTLPYMFFQTKGWKANDALFTKKDNKLTLTSYPFTKTIDHEHCTVAQSLDHYKALCFMQQPLSISKNLKLSSQLRVRIYGASTHPFTQKEGFVYNAVEDYRLACGGIALWDFCTGVQAFTVLTKKSVYALYGRNAEPSKTTCKEPYFLQSKLLYTMEPSQESIDCSIEYCAQTNSFVWVVEGTERCSVKSVGSRCTTMDTAIDNGFASKEVTLRQCWVGFGTFTFLDAMHPIGSVPGTALVPLLPNNQYTQSNVLQKNVHFYNYDGHQLHKLWGQGCSLTIHSLSLCREVESTKTIKNL